MNRPLKQAVRDHFEQRALSKDRLEYLESLLRVNEPQPTARRHISRPLITWSVAAIAVVLVVAMLAGRLEVLALLVLFERDFWIE